MSYAKLNIWIRYADCTLIHDCWRTDLVIKTPSGDYLVDMDSSLVEKLREAYPDYQIIEKNPSYQGATRIKIKPGGGKYINHVEVPVPPGVYVIWTRVCHGLNEETNKQMVIVNGGEHKDVNLLLNTVEMCVNEVIHPLLVKAVEIGIPQIKIQEAAQVLMDVGQIPKNKFILEIGQRVEEAAEKDDPVLKKVLTEVHRLSKGIKARLE